MKKGFGLLEVLAAAIVLGFLVVGLLRLQVGNREAILRIRARDAANIIAQHVLDSLGAVGINSIVDDVPGDTIINNKVRRYAFGGETDITQEKKFFVTVEYIPSPSSNSGTVINTDTDINDISSLSEPLANNIFAKNVKATISWDFNGSMQSIKIDKVLR